MSLTNTLYIISIVTSFILSILIGSRRKNHSSIYFSIIIFSTTFWILSNFIVSNTLDPSILLFWIRTTMIGPIIIGPFFFLFTKAFLSEGKLNLKNVTLTLFPSLLFFPFIYTEFNVKSAIPATVLGQSVSFIPGILYCILGLYLAFYIVLGFWTLASKYRYFSNPITKKQIKYIFIGFLSTFIISLSGTLVLPLMGYTKYGIIGPLSTVIFSIITFFNIFRYQFLDTRLFIGKIAYYVLLGIPLYIMYFSLAFVYESIYGTSFNNMAYIIGIPIALSFTYFLNIFTKYISEYTDTHLINPGYNPLEVLEQHSQKLSNTLDIDSIIKESLFILARTIRPGTSGIILIDGDKSDKWLSVNYKSNSYKSPNEFKIFTEYFQQHNEKSINYYDLALAESIGNTSLLQNKHLSSELNKHNLRVILALKEEATVKGLLLVGKKEADDPYNSQEIKFLERIADNISLSLGRALLYKETQQFNIELQQKISDATSELQTKNKDLEEAFAQLEEVRRQEKDMLDVMGHELRTPISISRNALLALQNSLNKNTADPVKIKRYIDMAAEGARREIALVETLLSTTKLEGSRMQINPEPVDLKTAVSYSVRSHKEFAQKGRTELVFIEPKESIVVTADKIRIQEIIDNFINNAIKYTGEGKVEVSIEKKDGLGWVNVKDNGIGISEENLKHLGKKFFRVQQLYNQSNNKVNPSGTGLGLFVSFQLIELMKGKKSIISKEGKGSTFSFGLPISKKLPST